MKKILFLGHSALAGGAEYCLDITLRFLDRRRIQPYVFFATGGPLLQRTRELGIPADVLPMSWWMLYTPSLWEWKNRLGIPSRIRLLTDFIRHHQIDAVYTNTVTLFEGAMAAKKAGVPHVYHIHEVLRDENMQPRWFSLTWTTQWCYRHSARVIFESQAAKEVAGALLPAGFEADFAEKSRVVSNSSRFTAEEKAEFDPVAIRQAWGLSPEKVTILWMGRFSPRKNPRMLLEAVARMRNRDAVQVLFIGEGPLEPEMRAVIAEKNLAATCRIVPFQSDIRPLLAVGDIMVLTSTEESFGLVLVEAGIFGLPAVATQVEGPRHIIADTETGFLIPPDDACFLAEKLDLLAENVNLRKEMGAKMCARVETLFNPAETTRQIQQILEEILV